MIRLDCLWTKSNSSFTCTVRLLFRSFVTFSTYENKLIAKWAPKKLFYINYFVVFLDNCTHKNVKPRKSRYWGFSLTLTPVHLFAIRGWRKRDLKFFKIALGTRLASAKGREVNGKPDKINELILKKKTDLKVRPVSI